MQANNAPPDHQPGIACPIWNPAGKVERKSNRFESRMNSIASGIPGGAFLCTFVPFCSFQNLIYGATSIWCSLNHYLAKYSPKRHILPICGRPGEHPPGRKVLRTGCTGLHPAAKVERVWKSNQSRRGIPYLKVEWFCAKKSLAKSNRVCIMHFCFMIQVYTPYFAHSACIVVVSKGTPAKVGQSSGVCGW